MKIIKTFEGYKRYNLRIDDYTLIRLMDVAIDKKNYSTISDILDSNYDNIHESFEKLIEQSYPDVKIINMFIDKVGENLVNKKPYGAILLHNVALHSTTKFNILKKLIQKGHDLFMKDSINNDFFYYLELYTFNKKFINKILSFIKEESPEQYEKYIMKKDTDRFNL